MRKQWVVAASAFALGCATTAWLGGQAEAAARGIDPRLERALELFGDVLSVIERQYADEVDAPALVIKALDAMVSGLDPRSDYISAEEYAALRDRARPKPEAPPEAHVELSGDVAVVRPGSLTDEAVATVERELAELRLGRTRLSGVVLDLRGNPGGILEAAFTLTDLFLEGGEVVSTRGRDPRDIERYVAQPGGIAADLPMAVLVDGGTAGGAEVVAAALQDHGRAVLVGAPTYGAGSIQTVMPLNGGRDGALKLTTSRWYAPSGRTLAGKGLTPDVPAEGGGALAAATAALAKAPQPQAG